MEILHGTYILQNKCPLFTSWEVFAFKAGELLAGGFKRMSVEFLLDLFNQASYLLCGWFFPIIFFNNTVYSNFIIFFCIFVDCAGAFTPFRMNQTYSLTSFSIVEWFYT